MNHHDAVISTTSDSAESYAEFSDVLKTHFANVPGELGVRSLTSSSSSSLSTLLEEIRTDVRDASEGPPFVLLTKYPENAVKLARAVDTPYHPLNQLGECGASSCGCHRVHRPRVRFDTRTLRRA
ncbi:hypothetical protein NFJ02_33g84390 [Pycnococcus provasolii]